MELQQTKILTAILGGGKLQKLLVLYEKCLQYLRKAIFIPDKTVMLFNLRMVHSFVNNA